MNEPTLSAKGSSWAISTPHSLASEAGAVAFERGGTAVDAALAAAVTLAVSYPENCGVGGDLFALIHRPDGDILCVNSSGRSPAAADPERLRAEYRGAVPVRGPWPITVPGAVAGWQAVHRIGGALPWRDAFAQAIALAFGGVNVARSLASELAEEPAVFAGDPGLAAIYFPDGLPLPRFATFRQPALGATLQHLADEGPGALYRGALGARYVAGLRAAGSSMTIDDLAAHEAIVQAPLASRVAGLHVSVAPPNSQGYGLLQILGCLERLGAGHDPLGEDAGTFARAVEAAGRDRDRHLADPDRMSVHVSTLLDDGHMAALCDEIRERHAGSPEPRPRAAGDTIALVAADARGWAVSLIQSLYYGFGAAFLEPATGIVAQNRGACFALEAGHPNDYAAGVRPAHTLMPVLVGGAEGLVGIAGTSGGHAQPQINAQTVARGFVLGVDPADAVAAPRWLVGGSDRTTEPPFVVTEHGVPAVAKDAIADAGFAIEEAGPGEGWVGHSHILRRDGREFVVGCDPRSDGSALAG